MFCMLDASDWITIAAVAVAATSVIVSVFLFYRQQKAQALLALRSSHLDALKIGLENPTFLGVSQEDLTLADGTQLSGDDAKKYSMYVYFLLNVVEQAISYDGKSNDWRALVKSYASAHGAFLRSISSEIKNTYSKELREVLGSELPGAGW